MEEKSLIFNKMVRVTHFMYDTYAHTQQHFSIQKYSVKSISRKNLYKNIGVRGGACPFPNGLRFLRRRDAREKNVRQVGKSLKPRYPSSTNTTDQKSAGGAFLMQNKNFTKILIVGRKVENH